MRDIDSAEKVSSNIEQTMERSMASICTSLSIILNQSANQALSYGCCSAEAITDSTAVVLSKSKNNCGPSPGICFTAGSSAKCTTVSG